MINEIEAVGYDPHVVPLDATEFADLLKQIEHHVMYDDRGTKDDGLLIASPFGFTHLSDASAFDHLLPPSIAGVLFEHDEVASDKPTDSG